MKRLRPKIALAAILPAFACGADQLLATSSPRAARLDLATQEIRIVSQTDELLPFACNSASDWRAGGEEGVASFVRIVKAVGTDAADRTTWSDVGADQLAEVAGEGTVEWVPTARMLYRAELVAGETVLAQAFFNLLDCTDIADTRISLDEATLALAVRSMPYDGTEREPAVTVTCGGEVLSAGTDYSVIYADNLQPGTATVTVIGVGDYTGERSETFEIVPAAAEELARDSGEPVCADFSDGVLTVRFARDLLPFAWNTSETFQSYEPCAWRPGGLDAETEAVATIRLLPMAGPDATPDEGNALTVSMAAGEGVTGRIKCPRGYYQAQLTITKAGVPVTGSLVRVIRVASTPGIIIMIQ